MPNDTKQKVDRLIIQFLRECVAFNNGMDSKGRIIGISKLTNDFKHDLLAVMEEMIDKVDKNYGVNTASMEIRTALQDLLGGEK